VIVHDLPEMHAGPHVVRRLGLIGDVHAEDERLGIAIAALHAEKVERILCCGDLVDGHGDVDRTCSTLALHGVTTVRGNHDRWIRDDDMRTLPNAHRMTALTPLSIDLLKSLPRTMSIDVPGGKLLLCHGIGENDMRQLGPEDSGYAISSNDDLLKVLFDATVAVMVVGHTHKPMVRRFERGGGKPALIVVNPGTLAREDGSGFAVLDLSARRVDFHRITDTLTVEPATRAVF
jgi:putative phosphoesterase